MLLSAPLFGRFISLLGNLTRSPNYSTHVSRQGYRILAPPIHSVVVGLPTVPDASRAERRPTGQESPSRRNTDLDLRRQHPVERLRCFSSNQVIEQEPAADNDDELQGDAQEEVTGCFEHISIIAACAWLVRRSTAC